MTPFQSWKLILVSVAVEEKPDEMAIRSRLSTVREWLFRLVCLIGSPILFLLLLESGLRIAGYGYETDFLVKIPGRESYMPNENFG